MDKVNFRPWIGADYETGGIFGKKILVLGESHYCIRELYEGGRCFPECKRELMNEDCYSQTEQVVNDFINNYEGELYHQTFLCFERAVMGKELSNDESKQFWNSVAFYNYFQYSQSGPVRPLENVSKDSAEGLHQILNTLSPDYIIVWGQRCYNNVPSYGGYEEQLTIDNGDSAPVWVYTINGKKIPALRVYHPSCPKGKKRDYWHQYYKKFLNLAE